MANANFSKNQNSHYLGKDPLYIAALGIYIGPKRQTKSEQFFQANVSSKKQTNEFYFTTMKPQVDLFLLVFWKKLKAPKRHFEIK